MSGIYNPTSSGGPGGGAPDNAQYLVLSLDGTLSAERKFVPAEGLTATDGGANGNYSLAATSYVLDRNVASVDISVSTTTTIYSYIIQPNILGTDKCIHFYVAGDYLTNPAVSNSYTLAIALGATNMYVDGSVAFAANAARRPFIFDIYLGNEGATNAQVVSGLLLHGTAGGATTGIGNLGTITIAFNAPFLGTAAADSTATLTFMISVRQLVGGTSTSFRKRIAYAEIL